ncbi:putative MFS transporter, AGZA family, xanthine/uracil permease [Alkalithermobacter thermoalcaliphilus JW-YL-7 = DSM 7308]|uniref:MFS transporter, AGZA family, xanthine/uracil permease n=1 Tax=Alkalithermobacter thermoalcaliphilus JW-YL-7 = DSM 7308 TaxID=1121328 RepID=A0A150FRS9_CLOPD|nr:Xanthine/uracil/vitamin C permease [[Clostridium] paradoxum JW-YL-7 = DSM 7308]SHK37780.1 putative MFS transporter, AGZA family, xanthine/uracil permease [[Clostridium] paradoxum JW-YL-7 = DSM 7308]
MELVKQRIKTSILERTFELSKHNTDAKTEILAGMTTFMTMAYILIVNPSILSATGMDFGALFTATALSSVVATLIMALYANLPFALAPAMGPNAFFAFTVVLGMGYSWEMALTAVFLEGIIFIILSFFNVREAIINSIPIGIKKAVSAGIGLFIAFLGLFNSGIVVSGMFHVGDGKLDGIPLTIGHISSGSGLLAIIGIIITGFLLAKNVKGALLLGILITTVLGIPMGVTTLPEGLKFISTPPSLSPIMFKFEWSNIFSIDMLVILFTFLFVDMFDTVGTLVGVATKTNMLDKDGNIPNAKQALFADAIGTTIGAFLGTSTVTTYVESASGVADGGRTGLTALSTAMMFAIALFLSPLFIMIPAAATAPALILVGLFMISPVKEIDFDDFTEAIPVFLTIIMMPLTYSIAEGIVFGMLSYVILKLLTGRQREVSKVMYIVSFMFLIKIILG